VERGLSELLGVCQRPLPLVNHQASSSAGRGV